MHKCTIQHRRMHGLRFWILVAFILTQFSATHSDTAMESSRSPIPPVLKVSSWNDMPYSSIVNENGKWVGKGYAFYILELLGKRLNFSYTVVPPREHTLSAMMEMLSEKKVDMVAAFLPALPQLQVYCTFSVSLDESELTAIMKRPPISSTGAGLLAPFDETVWILILVSIVSMGPLMYLFALIRARLWNDPNSENYGLSSYIWFVYSSLVKQGTSVVATTDSTRILFATWLVFILILSSFYTANLTAFLTTPQFTLPINSLEDIVYKGYYWVSHGGRTIEFLLNQNYTTQLSLMKPTQSWKGSYTFKYDEPLEVLNAVDQKKLFLAESHYLRTLIFQDYKNKTREMISHTARCTYVVMPGTIFAKDRAFAFPLNSTIRAPINTELLMLVEAGVVQYVKNNDLPNGDLCPVDLRSSDRRMKNADLSLTYKIVIGGYLISVAVFLLEVILGLIMKLIRALKGKKCLCIPCGKKEESNESTDTPEVPIYHLPGSISNEQPNLLKGNPEEFYQNMKTMSLQGKKYYVNGRDYYVVVDRDGDQRLIPIRTPSAFLFQYAA